MIRGDVTRTQSAATETREGVLDGAVLVGLPRGRYRSGEVRGPMESCRGISVSLEGMRPACTTTSPPRLACSSPGASTPKAVS